MHSLAAVDRKVGVDLDHGGARSYGLVAVDLDFVVVLSTESDAGDGDEESEKSKRAWSHKLLTTKGTKVHERGWQMLRSHS
jgi:hypothetical protein